MGQGLPAMGALTGRWLRELKGLHCYKEEMGNRRVVTI